MRIKRGFKEKFKVLKDHIGICMDMLQRLNVDALRTFWLGTNSVVFARVKREH